MNAHLEKVQWLSIEEVAEQWAPQLKLQKTVIQRELQYAMYKLERAKTGEHCNYDEMKRPLDEAPAPKDMPSPETLLNREFIERFATNRIGSCRISGLTSSPSARRFLGDLPS